jgi:glycosyltransferase involved in cell wall biosynthesis
MAVVVPGGVDRSGERRVIPAFVALIGRLSRAHEVHVYALHQEQARGEWRLGGAHVHNVGSGRLLWLRALTAIRAQHRRAPFDMVQALFCGTAGAVAVAASRVLHIPVAIHVAGGELASLCDIGYGGARHAPRRLIERWLLRSADGVTAASAPMIDAIQALGIRARRIPLGAEPRVWCMRTPRRRDLSKPVRLIHVASLNRVKDQPTLLQALAMLRDRGHDFRMEVVGEDTLAGETQALVAQLALESRVRFLGFLTQADTRLQMEQADLLVMSSRHEAGPLVILEAAATGVPTVGTAVGHIAEWAPDAAVAVPTRDAAALARGMESLIVDEDRRLRIAHAAQARAAALDADYTAGEFAELHAALLSARS